MRVIDESNEAIFKTLTQQGPFKKRRVNDGMVHIKVNMQRSRASPLPQRAAMPGSPLAVQMKHLEPNVNRSILSELKNSKGSRNAFNRFGKKRGTVDHPGNNFVARALDKIMLTSNIDSLNKTGTYKPTNWRYDTSNTFQDPRARQPSRLSEQDAEARERFVHMLNKQSGDIAFSLNGTPISTPLHPSSPCGGPRQALKPTL